MRPLKPLSDDPKINRKREVARLSMQKKKNLSEAKRAVLEVKVEQSGLVPPRKVSNDVEDVGVDNFLYPKMPDVFKPALVRLMTREELRARYLEVFSASMGNHSLALFYCCWKQIDFDYQMTKKFARDILLAKEQLADRATFIMHQGIGLVKVGDKQAKIIVTNAMAKIVEKMAEGTPKSIESANEGGFKLLVKGLDRNAPSPVSEVRQDLETKGNA